MTALDPSATRSVSLATARNTWRSAGLVGALAVLAAMWAAPAAAGTASIGALSFTLTDTDAADGIDPSANISFVGGLLSSYWVLAAGGYQDSGYTGMLNPDRSASSHVLGSATAYDADGKVGVVSDGLSSVAGDGLLFSSGTASDVWSIVLSPHTALTIAADGVSSGSGSVALRLSDGFGSWSDSFSEGVRGLRIVWETGSDGGTAQFVRTAEATFTPGAVAAVPEPSNAALLLAGLACVGLARQRIRGGSNAAHAGAT